MRANGLCSVSQHHMGGKRDQEPSTPLNISEYHMEGKRNREQATSTPLNFTIHKLTECDSIFAVCVKFYIRPMHKDAKNIESYLNPARVGGIRRITLAECSQMSANMRGFQLFSGFWYHFVLAKLATISMLGLTTSYSDVP